MKSTAALLLLQGLQRNVGAGIRLAVFFPVSRYDFRISPADFVLLWAFNLLAWLAGGMLRGGFPGYVDYGALPLALAEIPLVLLASLIIASLYRKRELLLGIAPLLISPDASFDLVSSAIVIALRFAGADTPPAVQLTAYVAYLVWVLAVALRALWVAAGWHRRQFIHGSVLLIVLFLFLVNFMPRTEFWAAYREASADSTQNPILREELFHAQDGLLDTHLAALLPQRAGMADCISSVLRRTEPRTCSAKSCKVSRLMRERFDAVGHRSCSATIR